jgi:hypothetical protein
MTKLKCTNTLPGVRKATLVEGEEKASFLRFVGKMLCWEPSERSPAQELINDEWIHS